MICCCLWIDWSVPWIPERQKVSSWNPTRSHFTAKSSHIYHGFSDPCPLSSLLSFFHMTESQELSLYAEPIILCTSSYSCSCFSLSEDNTQCESKVQEMKCRKACGIHWNHSSLHYQCITKLSLLTRLFCKANWAPDGLKFGRSPAVQA